MAWDVGEEPIAGFEDGRSKIPLDSIVKNVSEQIDTDKLDNDLEEMGMLHEEVLYNF